MYIYAYTIIINILILIINGKYNIISYGIIYYISIIYEYNIIKNNIPNINMYTHY